MEKYEDIVQALFEDLSRFRREKINLSERTDLVADLGMESINVMELLQEIEDRYDISIPLNIMPDIRTVEDLARQIQHLTIDRA
ncbi:MAG: acyl carrier protein [Gammaproteobacteria bacterium HGW-Gammaproteobacteria-3]|nr:MAG: acyl carrier protein [Gammaproteobacteria bacterium HGW-Gammaproteobacteria-3]